MNDHGTAFDAQPDPELGAALRRALEPRDPRVFAARVLARLAGARAPAWEVLAGWARRGIAIAAAATLVIGILAGPVLSRVAGFDDALATTSADGSLPPIALLTAERPPEPGALFASLVQ